MRKWLRRYYQQYLDAVRSLTFADRDTAEEWATWMRKQWEENGKISISQQKGLLWEVRSALKADLGDEHVALKTMKFSTGEWIEANRPTSQRIAEQNSKQRILTPRVVNAIVTKGTQILSSREWADIAAGLAVLTGRRSTEVMKTATFTPKTDYSVTFSGALKRKGEQTPVVFEIPTLCRAEYILKAIQRLREVVPTNHLTETQVNNRYSRSVAQSCNHHFADLVEPPVGKDNLYTHLFRKIYATIATYFYCPLDVDDAEYRAEIQGHFSGHENLSLAERRSIASDRNYRAYIILDEENKSQKGTRLHWQGVKVIEAFAATSSQFSQQPEFIERQRKEQAQSTMTSNKPEKRDFTSLSIWRDEKERWNNVLNEIVPEQANRKEDRVSLLLEWIENQLNNQDGTPPANSTVDASVPALNSKLQEHDIAIAQLRGELEVLKIRLSRGGEDSLQENRITELERENTALRLERDQAIAKLDQFRTLLTENSNEESSQEQKSAAYDNEEISYSTASVLEQQSSEPLKPRQRQSSDLLLDPDIERALKSIMAYNDSCTTHAEKWAISYPVMKDLLAKISKTTQSKIKAVFDAHEHQIEQHHRKHSLGQRHNRKHQDESITDVIRDFG